MDDKENLNINKEVKVTIEPERKPMAPNQIYREDGIMETLLKLEAENQSGQVVIKNVDRDRDHDNDLDRDEDDKSDSNEEQTVLIKQDERVMTTTTPRFKIKDYLLFAFVGLTLILGSIPLLTFFLFKKPLQWNFF